MPRERAGKVQPYFVSEFSFLKIVLQVYLSLDLSQEINFGGPQETVPERDEFNSVG
jgi:hypothetical protein